MELTIEKEPRFNSIVKYCTAEVKSYHTYDQSEVRVQCDTLYIIVCI